jgi:hypothetical protein
LRREPIRGRFGACESSLDFVENLRVGGVAPKIMIKLADAVVVTGASRQQTQAVGQRPQPATSVGIMILMIDLDAVQSMIIGKNAQRAWRQHTLTSATPGMGDHRKAAGLMNQLDATLQLDGVTGYVSRTSVGQKPVECFLPIPNMACLDKRVGYVWPTDGGTVAYLSHHLRFANRHTKGGELNQHASQPAEPTVTD